MNRSRRWLLAVGILAGTLLPARQVNAVDWRQKLSGKALTVAVHTVSGEQVTHVETTYSLCADGSARQDVRTTVTPLGAPSGSAPPQHHRLTGRWWVDDDSLVLEFDGEARMRLADEAGVLSLDGEPVVAIEPADCRLD